MMRRVLQNGSRVFGMALHVSTPNGYPDVLTRVRVRGLRLLPDGRSYVDAVAEVGPNARVRVITRSAVDGYAVAQTLPFIDTDIGLESVHADHADALFLNTFINKIIAATKISTTVTEDDPFFETLFGNVVEPINFPDVILGLQALRVVLQASGLPPENGLMLHSSTSNDAQRTLWWLAATLPADDRVKTQWLETTTFTQRLRLITQWVRDILGGGDVATMILHFGKATSEGECNMQ